MQRKPKIAAVDLFCGIGGLTFGLKKAGIKVRAGIDVDLSCKYAYEANNKAKFIHKDVSSISGTDLEQFWKTDEIRVLVGCAPCQPFSSHSNKIKGKEKGERWNLINEFQRIVRETEPTLISMENVPNLSSKSVFEEFVQQLNNLKYHVSYKNVYCPDYGIPQKRRRLVLLGSKLGHIALIPATHKPSNYRTVRDVIGHFECLVNGQRSKFDKLHFTSHLSKINLLRIKASKPNGTWEDWVEDLRLECHKRESGKTYKAVYGRMAWDEPSPTITTQFYNYGTGRFGHPAQHRAITVREASILQSFPADYKFAKEDEDIPLTKIGTHIGNAVPVDLGYVIGKSMLEHLKKMAE